MSSMLKGKFIVLDGPDGCGKSTQVRLLAEHIAGAGIDVVSYRDPGTTVVGEKIRAILLDPSHEGMGDNVEVLLYMAARAQLWLEHIGPDLAAGRCVLMDRWVSSTCAYQGWAGGFGIERVIRIAADALTRVWADRTIILDVDLNTAKQRMCRQLDRMEQKGDAYHAKVREGFLKLPDYDSNARIVNGRLSIENVHRDILNWIQQV
ncbi:MAG TPA: dTMP kinase [Anaerohalosphaeraceae bacterium]|nr:dTMP kinase [Anaerohalosphaeraceae bacterium]HOL32121.1 dTMP kinase [Anaerohalosphaeraceae bacterium]HOM76148.1 dTMP kinase [Anaerohalosphaeraceae bacterium]HPC63186.1 dTMP kinase [Anaerohalosphaeraceae bacterium]HPO70042.1 dTMP kinase [Anaerohalosphaeraceae bacterium]